MTVLEALIHSVTRAGEFNRDDQVGPAVVLWPDKDRQWEALMPLLRERVPHLLTLGAYDAKSRTGPAVWLQCMMARTLPEAQWPEKAIPILYLPGVSRQELRAVSECPATLMPLAELQYRGAFWSQVNHKDWTVLCCLPSIVAMKVDGKPNVAVEYDRLELLHFLSQDFGSMNAMCERAQMVERGIYDRTKAVFEYFDLPFDAEPP